MKTEKIYIKRHTYMLVKDYKIQSVMTLKSKLGSRGKWNIAGDENGIYNFANCADRDNKIKQLVSQGAILK
jgi:hypothetical protein